MHARMLQGAEQSRVRSASFPIHHGWVSCGAPSAWSLLLAAAQAAWPYLNALSSGAAVIKSMRLAKGAPSSCSAVAQQKMRANCGGGGGPPPCTSLLKLMPAHGRPAQRAGRAGKQRCSRGHPWGSRHSMLGRLNPTHAGLSATRRPRKLPARLGTQAPSERLEVRWSQPAPARASSTRA